MGNNQTRDIFKLAQNGKWGVVNGLVKNMKVDVNTEGPQKKTILFYAIEQGNYRMVEYLIKSGCHVHVRDQKRNTPLHHASMMGEVDMMKLLIFNGANMEVKNQLGRTPVFFSVFHPEALEFLLEKKVQINVLDKTEKNILHVFVKEYSGSDGNEVETICELLYKSKCDFLAVDAAGKSPIDYCELNSSNNLIRSVVEEYVERCQRNKKREAERVKKSETATNVEQEFERMLNQRQARRDKSVGKPRGLLFSSKKGDGENGFGVK